MKNRKEYPNWIIDWEPDTGRGSVVHKRSGKVTPFSRNYLPRGSFPQYVVTAVRAMIHQKGDDAK